MRKVVGNLEEKNVGTKGKSPKQGLTSAEVLTTMLPGVRGPPTITYLPSLGIVREGNLQNKATHKQLMENNSSNHAECNEQNLKLDFGMTELDIISN